MNLQDLRDRIQTDLADLERTEAAELASVRRNEPAVLSLGRLITHLTRARDTADDILREDRRSSHATREAS
jgi:hypothetical protein